MKRRDFLRNTMMAFAVSLVPKILQPSIPEAPKLIAAWCKVANEMFKDIKALEWFSKSVALRNLSKVDGYDPLRPIEIKFVDDEDDFIMRTKTLVITQVI